jgi:UDP-N-acetyl-D-glucosamine/UDP-N-acetyl-D-galactosamine dehydrogenase
VVAVPTPIDGNRKPDLRPVVGATATVGAHMRAGCIVVYESTVYPGLTEEICVPLLEEKSGLTCGRDFTVGYSPERINPGDKVHTLESIVKVVAGQDQPTADLLARFYACIVKAGVHRASSIKVAEAAKVIENTQRDLNIALMNELALIFDRMGIDTGEVLQAAGTKWNFLPFRPGLVGGHCIGVDPYYLTFKAESIGFHPQVILAGRRINDGMGKFIAEKTIKAMIDAGCLIKGARVGLLGLTFKENVPDLRNSRVEDIIHELVRLPRRTSWSTTPWPTPKKPGTSTAWSCFPLTGCAISTPSSWRSRTPNSRAGRRAHRGHVQESGHRHRHRRQGLSGQGRLCRGNSITGGSNGGHFS